MKYSEKAKRFDARDTIRAIDKFGPGWSESVPDKIELRYYYIKIKNKNLYYQRSSAWPRKRNFTTRLDDAQVYKRLSDAKQALKTNYLSPYCDVIKVILVTTPFERV